ncbi:MAG TPA: type II secretion system F family protein [Ktedonobacterales bacterium]
MSPLLGPLAGFMTFFGILLLIFGMASRRRPNAMDERIKGLVKPRTLEDYEMQQPFRERFIRPLLAGIARFFSRLTPSSSLDSTHKRLQAAGMQGRMQVSDFVGLKGMGTVIGLGVAFLFAFLGHSALGSILLMMGLFGAVGYFVPDLWLRSKTDQRKLEISNALPDTIDLLTISVEAGLGFDQAMGRIVSKSNNMLSREFGRVLQQMRLGVPRRDALRQMADRTGVDDVSQFVGAIVQAEQLGASVGRVLRVQSSEMRVRRRQRAQKLAQQAPIKMLFPMAFLIMPSIFVVVLGPAIPRIVKVFVPNAPL